MLVSMTFIFCSLLELAIIGYKVKGEDAAAGKAKSSTPKMKKVRMEEKHKDCLSTETEQRQFTPRKLYFRETVHVPARLQQQQFLQVPGTEMAPGED